MSRLESAAIALHEVFWNNTGQTADWPIQLKLDADIHPQVVGALNELSEAVAELHPELVPWPLEIEP